MDHIVFEGRKYKKIAFNIATGAPFHEIIKKINSIGFPENTVNEEEIRYAVLELINNSLRAQRQHKIQQDIRTELHLDGSELSVSITDRGPGFNVEILPYSLETPVDEIDTNSRSFQAYREKNHYKHFGMGLLIARRQFPRFKIIFLNSEGTEVPYTPGGVAGTRIEMSKRLNNG